MRGNLALILAIVVVYLLFLIVMIELGHSDPTFGKLTLRVLTHG